VDLRSKSTLLLFNIIPTMVSSGIIFRRSSDCSFEDTFFKNKINQTFRVFYCGTIKVTLSRMTIPVIQPFCPPVLCNLFSFLGLSLVFVRCINPSQRGKIHSSSEYSIDPYLPGVKLSLSCRF